MSGVLLGREVLVKNLSSFSTGFIAALTEAVEMTQANVSNFAKQNHPYIDRTGQLTNSIQPGRVLISKDDLTGEVLADKDYASFVELGTSRSRPFPFLYPALAQAAPFFRRVIKRAFEAQR